MTAELARRRPAARQIRDRQRIFHLIAGALLIGYVYLPIEDGSLYDLGIRWVALPLLVLDGIAMWQWPRIRRLARRLEARRPESRKLQVGR